MCLSLESLRVSRDQIKKKNQFAHFEDQGDPDKQATWSSKGWLASNSQLVSVSPSSLLC